MDPNDWTLTGNSGTDPHTNFLGTTDERPLVIKTKNEERMRIEPHPLWSVRIGGILTANAIQAFPSLESPPVPFDILSSTRIFSDGDWSSPQLHIQQKDLDGWARIRLSRIGKYWDIAVGGEVGSEVMNFYSEQNNNNIMTLAHDGAQINGNLTVFNNTQINGTLTGTLRVSDDIVLTNADCAEEFDIEASAEVKPGTVMILDQDGRLHQSTSAYDKRVAGVISGGGDYKPGVILDKQQVLPNRKPVALVGKVYCKVDAGYGPIEVGDLLTTSDMPGHAMKAVDPLRAFGSVIGKALRPLKAGQGMIPILIALQ